MARMAFTNRKGPMICFLQMRGKCDRDYSGYIPRLLSDLDGPSIDVKFCLTDKSRDSRYISDIQKLPHSDTVCRILESKSDLNVC